MLAGASRVARVDLTTLRSDMKRVGVVMLLAASLGTSAFGQMPSAPLGPYAARCTAGDSPSILVTVVGLKSRTGTIRVRTFGGATSTWFEKTKWITRVEVPTPASGPIRVCLPVAAPGTYAIDMRHDMNGNSETDRSDGGGASGDPKVTLLDFVFGRKPPPHVTAVTVGRGVTEITVTAMYLRGGALRPLAASAR
ncbi:DUF2141 domain-containing protein [Sphingomonas radiodurans]|uniref:DUF2141 domain-containing protein n=1 Tax=Sphingomonas radiodurans TaxID=2890321 RepID=UPI001E31D863|nr:DUF2141 domain-containing protein [Sphingomonas radiodurans]WBH16226.1 DUF2141 domain-containing protein [Sphingomonas radiodurans]